MATPAEENPNAPQEDGELVTEFPPPPYYYTLASSTTLSSTSKGTNNGSTPVQNLPKLTPPPIPYKALERASMKAVQEMNKKKEEAERNRLAAAAAAAAASANNSEGGVGITSIVDITNAVNVGNTTGSIIGGDAPDFEKRDTMIIGGNGGEGGNGDDNQEDVAVFGEYVEDPLLSPVDDCADPKIVKEEIFR